MQKCFTWYDDDYYYYEYCDYDNDFYYYYDDVIFSEIWDEEGSQSPEAPNFSWEALHPYGHDGSASIDSQLKLVKNVVAW